MPLPQADPAKLQKGFAYFAHASRSDSRAVSAASEELGTWEEAALVFVATTVELLHQISRILGEDVTDVAERLALGAALVQTQGAAPQ